MIHGENMFISLWLKLQYNFFAMKIKLLDWVYNKPKGLKVANSDQMAYSHMMADLPWWLMGMMTERHYGQKLWFQEAERGKGGMVA